MAKTQKKYIVDYCSGATGYGWKQEFDRLDEFASFVDHLRSDVTARVVVWDESIKDFIFWKNCLEWKPEIDKLRDMNRDRRTRTKEHIAH